MYQSASIKNNEKFLCFISSCHNYVILSVQNNTVISIVDGNQQEMSDLEDLSCPQAH